MLNQTRRLSALLRRFEIDLLRKCAEETLGDQFRRRRSKNDYVRDLQTANISAQQLAVVLQQVAGGWDRTTNAPPLVQWRESILGPLGMTEARQLREVAHAADMVEGLLLGALKETHLETVAAKIAPDLARVARESSLTDVVKHIALAQACLHGSDEELVKAVNEAISSVGPLLIDNNEPYVVGDWLVTPWGLLTVPNASTEYAIAQILCERGGSRLESVLPEVAGTQQLERCAIYVLQVGPTAAIDEFFSHADVWEFLKTKGLLLSAKADTHFLRELLLQFVGLRPAPRPDGLLRQYSELLRHDVQRGRPEESDARSWHEIRRFERNWASAAFALIETALGIGMPIADWLSSNGHRALVDKKLVSRKQKPFGEMTLGNKRQVLERIFAAMEGLPECVQKLAEVGRAPANIGAAFCGEQIGRLIEARNELAHPKKESPPAWTSIRTHLLEALRPLAVPAVLDGIAIAPPVVRLLEERTDSTGWTRCELETEVGEVIVASPRGQYLARRNFHLVARNGSTIVKPVLVPIQLDDE